MKILELQKYGEDNGFDSLEFKFTDLKGKLRKGHWIDAYMGLFWYDGLKENGFITVWKWRELFGDDSIEFEIDQ